jgi:hypothetical protein
MRRRFWVAVILGGISAALAILTLFTREWVEVIFGIDPDGGSGALEWVIVAASAVIAVGCAAWARMEWTHAHPATG